MSYGNKYWAEWCSENLSGYLYIDEKDYEGESEEIILTNITSIHRSFDNWENYIIGSALEFEVFNNRTDYFDLLELMTATERQFKVRVIITDSFKLFEGFLNVDTVVQKYFNIQVIRLVASSFLSKLKHIIPGSLDELKTMSFIDIIDEILRLTGGEFDIRVNASLYANGDTLSPGQTLFNKNGFFTEAFWENNVDKKNSLEILKSVLNTFNCYLYWWDGYWYIEHFNDLWTTPTVDYVEYSTGVSYKPRAAGSTGDFSRVVDDVGDLKFIKMTQELSITPGYKLIRINADVDDGLLLNFTINDFSDVESIHGVVPYPNFRTWQKWDDDDTYLTWLYTGSFNNIKDAISRFWWKGGITYIVENYIYSPHLIEWHRGLYTRFEVLVEESTKLSIKFKYGIAKGSFIYDFTGSLSDYEFNFSWYLRHPTGNYFIVKNEETGEWERVSSTEPSALQYTKKDGSDFDSDNMTVEVSFNIPLGEIVELIGDQEFVLGICTEEIIIKSGLYLDLPAVVCCYGDVVITVNSDLQSDVIEGFINTDFLDKKEIDMNLFDISNKNYKNGVLRGTDLDISTENWTLDGVDYYTLVEWMLINKFKMYNISRQKISGSVYSTSVLRPLQLYTESKQSDKKFILMELKHHLIEDVYDVVLFEFDTETEVNLI
jgi:hypothetical protein